MSELVFRSECHFYRKVVRAVLARLVLTLHSWLAIWLTVRLRHDDAFYCMFAYSVPLYGIELFLIVKYNKGCEWKRFCSAFLCYLLTIVPALWFQRLRTPADDRSAASNVTSGNSTDLTVVFGSDVQLPSFLSDVNLTSLQEQSMMIVLILCRWLLPRGRIDRNSMSNLLILYSGISADIMDFSEILSERRSPASWRYLLLAVWTWSLLQFTIVVRSGQLTKGSVDGASHEKPANVCGEILPMLMVIFMQDGPFFVARCYAILKLEIMNYTIIFFTLKNVLTLILTLYRLMVLCACVSEEGNDLLTMEEISKSKESLDMRMSGTSKSKKKIKRLH